MMVQVVQRFARRPRTRERVREISGDDERALAGAEEAAAI